jgi:drug/metabolite transporter (DMT)-like permease
MSFFLLGYATRFTAAANVSLFMLLETVLGPLWVWLVVDERPTNQMIMGGVLVVASLIAYLLWSMKQPVIQHS